MGHHPKVCTTEKKIKEVLENNIPRRQISQKGRVMYRESNMARQNLLLFSKIKIKNNLTCILFQMYGLVSLSIRGKLLKCIRVYVNLNRWKFMI